ncbi:mercury resistance system periplasmic binding protein MerP [Ramlibacter algicola]|uniref:Periplasmic mercury ion-binding protein n=1 Tax=Ramlibacter algicola TaxID=2795217 RepID=A0A934UQ22_9BURK|nr:mercury resistance system periplasmic binding protein MerP [Ramlibacter algicola]MBK0391361.1 mercury resistance system periplasmic binding protein MerP [Ramlibacter algicola]
MNNKLLALAATALLVTAAPAFAAQKQVTLSVPTMDCETCPVTIRVALMKVPGVSKAVVSYQRRNAKVTYDDAKTDVAALTKATEAAGYPSFAE